MCGLMTKDEFPQLGPGVLALTADCIAVRHNEARARTAVSVPPQVCDMHGQIRREVSFETLSQLGDLDT